MRTFFANMPLPAAYVIALKHNEELSVKIVKILLDGGLKVNDFPDILEAAVRAKRPKVAELLLNYGASNNTSAFLKSITEGYLDLTNLFLEYGANPNYENSFCKPLEIACSYGRYEIALSLIGHGANVNQKNAWGKSFLVDACHGRDARIVSLLLDKGLNVNTDIPLVTACYQEEEDNQIVDILLEAGADVNNSSEYFPPLSTAIEHASMKTIDKLLERGADIHYKNYNGKNILMSLCGNYSCRYRYEMVDFLIEKGVNINDRDCENRTALMHAIKECRADMVRELLKHNPDISIVDNRGRCAIKYAIKKAYDSDICGILKMIFEYGKKNNSENLKGLEGLIERMIEHNRNGGEMSKAFSARECFAY